MGNQQKNPQVWADFCHTQLDVSPLRGQGKGRLCHESVIDHDLAALRSRGFVFDPSREIYSLGVNI